MPVYMERLSVYIVVTLLCEGLETYRAGVRDLPSVHPLVVLQVVFGVETLVTPATLVVLLTSMSLHMDHQVVLVDEGFATFIADERSDVFVTTDVRLQVFLSTETPGADGTFVGSVSFA